MCVGVLQLPSVLCPCVTRLVIRSSLAGLLRLVRSSSLYGTVAHALARVVAGNVCQESCCRLCSLRCRLSTVGFVLKSSARFHCLNSSKLTPIMLFLSALPEGFPTRYLPGAVGLVFGTVLVQHGILGKT